LSRTPRFNVSSNTGAGALPRFLFRKGSRAFLPRTLVWVNHIVWVWGVTTLVKRNDPAASGVGYRACGFFDGPDTLSVQPRVKHLL
jgi:hypothetical protein